MKEIAKLFILITIHALFALISCNDNGSVPSPEIDACFASTFNDTAYDLTIDGDTIHIIKSCFARENSLPIVISTKGIENIYMEGVTMEGYLVTLDVSNINKDNDVGLVCFTLGNIDYVFKITYNITGIDHPCNLIMVKSFVAEPL